MVEDGDEIASAAVMDSTANGFCTDRGFALDDKEAEAMAGRTSFHPRILGLGGTGEEICFTGGKKERFSIEGRGTGFCIGAGLVSDEIVEIDPLIFDLTHSDGRPISIPRDNRRSSPARGDMGSHRQVRRSAGCRGPKRRQAATEALARRNSSSVMPQEVWIATSMRPSKKKKALRLSASSHTRARKPSRAET